MTASGQSGTDQSDINAAITTSTRSILLPPRIPKRRARSPSICLQLSQAYHGNPQREVQIFKSATPFVGRIPAADAGRADDIIAAMLKIAADPTFQKNHPREASDIFLSALLMSGQPNIVANDPNLHAEVLEAANDFIKEHPEDADKRLLEQVSLAEAGGAPETTPRGVINPSAE